MAGLAAGAALVTTRQNRRSTLEATTARLNLQILASQQTGQLMLAVENSGGGLAQTAGFAVLWRGFRASGHFGTGFLRPSERVVVRVDMPGPLPGQSIDDLYALASCRDTREFLHAWSSGTSHIMFRSRITRRPRYPDADAVFAEMFPDAESRGSVAVTWTLEE
jgi:hypothetical protein